MSTESVSEILVRSVNDPAFYRAFQDDPPTALAAYALSDEERDILISGDARMLALLGRSLEQGANPSPGGPDVTLVPSQDQPPQTGDTTRLHIQVQPWVIADGTVRYGAAVVPDGAAAASFVDVDGQTLPRVDVVVDLQPVYSQRPEGFAVEVVPTIRSTAPTSAILGRGERAPDPWGHNASGPDLLKAAKAVWSSTEGGRVGALDELIAMVRKGPASPPVSISDDRPVDIWIVGTGIRSGAHLTRETEAILREVDQIVYADSGVGVDEAMRALNPNVRPLFGTVYTERGPRLDTYQLMCRATLLAAMDGTVAFAVQGHPVVAVYAPFLIEDAARLLGLRVQVLPGISAFDTLCADLRFDPCVLGVQMFEATEMLLKRRALSPDVPAVIWQAGAVETRLYSNRRSKPTRFTRLVQHLGRTYAADHPVTIYYGSSHPLMDAIHKTVPLAELPQHAVDMHPGVTLFVPAVGVRLLQDEDLRGRLDDPAWLAAMTE